MKARPPFLALSLAGGALPWLALSLAVLLGGLAGHLLAGLWQELLALLPAETSPRSGSDTLLWAGQWLLWAWVLGRSTVGRWALPALLFALGLTMGLPVSLYYRAWGHEGLFRAAWELLPLRALLLALVLALALPGWQRSLDLAGGAKGEGSYERVSPAFCLVLLGIMLLWERWREHLPL